METKLTQNRNKNSLTLNLASFIIIAILVLTVISSSYAGDTENSGFGLKCYVRIWFTKDNKVVSVDKLYIMRGVNTQRRALMFAYSKANNYVSRNSLENAQIIVYSVKRLSGRVVMGFNQVAQ